MSPISFADCEYMYGQYYNWLNPWGGIFDLEEYVFGEDNCCDEYFLPMCGDDRVYFEKEIMLISQILRIVTLFPIMLH